MNSFLKRFILRQEKNFFKEARKYFFSEGVIFVVKEKQPELVNLELQQQVHNSWQFTVLVPKKTAKKASQRNDLKRDGREALKTVINEINTNDNIGVQDQKYRFSVVLFLKKQISQRQVIKEVFKILKKL